MILTLNLGNIVAITEEFSNALLHFFTDLGVDFENGETSEIENPTILDTDTGEVTFSYYTAEDSKEVETKFFEDLLSSAFDEQDYLAFCQSKVTTVTRKLPQDYQKYNMPFVE